MCWKENQKKPLNRSPVVKICILKSSHLFSVFFILFSPCTKAQSTYYINFIIFVFFVVVIFTSWIHLSRLFLIPTRNTPRATTTTKTPNSIHLISSHNSWIVFSFSFQSRYYRSTMFIIATRLWNTKDVAFWMV